MSVNVGAIIAAGGSSQRMNGEDKMLASLGGVPVILKTCLAFQVNENISEIVVSAKEENVELITELLREYGITKLGKVVKGGSTRFESIRNAFDALSDCDYVAIHDGARPLVSQRLINTCVETALEYDSAVPVIPSVDTLKKVQNECVLSTVDRASVYRVQTPQVFKREHYESALLAYSDSSYTDDCSMLEMAGYAVRVCEGATENIKLTVPSDLMYAEFLLKGDMPMVRIGHGYDVHRLVKDRKLILCGVDIPFDKGLLGHSDADVAVHALMDSLLGAASLGDIGRLFPDSSPEFSGISSMKLLKTVVDLLFSNGYTIGNIDITIIAQSPKLAPYIDDMRKNISEVCCIPSSVVNIKATTEEGLGFTGSGEGISAAAVSSITKNN